MTRSEGSDGASSHAACEVVRVAASAQLDGAAAPLSAAEVATHVAGCSDCAAHVAAMGEVTRRLRIAAAEPVPDLADAIVAAVAEDRVAGRLRQRRVLVGLAGAIMAVLAVADLATGGAASGHAARDAAALEGAVAVALGLAAWRPAVHARAVWGIVVVLGILGVVVAGVDVAAGRAGPLAETVHLVPLVAAWALLPWVDAPRRRRRAVVP